MTINHQNAWESQDETQNYGSGGISIDDQNNGHITDRGFSDELTDDELEGDEDELDTEDALATGEDIPDDDDLVDDDDDFSDDDEFDEDLENQADDTEGGGNLNA